MSVNSMIDVACSKPVRYILNGTVIACQAVFIGYLGFHLVGGTINTVVTGGSGTCVVHDYGYTTPSVDCSTDK